MSIKEKVIKLTKSIKFNIIALYVAFQSDDISKKAKLFVFITLAYALSPIDLIPDFIPILGYIDDLIFLPIAIFISIKLIGNSLWEKSKKEAKFIDRKSLPNFKFGVLLIIITWLFILLIAIKINC
jgi:uncharacterized membrane protein YkvA (DUF1232 family)